MLFVLSIKSSEKTIATFLRNLTDICINYILFIGELKMKKRGVSPVIATVLLIALVTAAAAIVFLVVIPMLSPSPQAIVMGSPSVDYDAGNNFTITVTIQAQAADITFNGTITISPDAMYLNPKTPAGSSILNGETGQIVFEGTFVSGEKYSVNIYFTSGDSTIFAIAEFTPTVPT